MISHNQQNVLSFLFQFGVRLERVSQIKALYFGRCNVHCCPPVENLPNSVKKRAFKNAFHLKTKKAAEKVFFSTEWKCIFFVFKTRVICFLVEIVYSIVKITFQLLWSNLNVYISSDLGRS